VIAVVNLEAATTTFARELCDALNRAYDAGLDEPIELLSIVNQAVLIILKQIPDAGYRQYIGELLAAKVPELVAIADPSWRGRHTLQ
jgi:hypothetical protein